MAKHEQAYLLIVAPNTLIMPVPEGEVGGDVQLSDVPVELVNELAGVRYDQDIPRAVCRTSAGRNRAPEFQLSIWPAL